MFQFQYGAIIRELSGTITCIPFRFQFQYGAIISKPNSYFIIT